MCSRSCALGRQFLLQVGKALAKGEMLGKLHEANQVASLAADVAIEQVLARVDVEAGASVRMQGTESDELAAPRSRSGRASFSSTAGLNWSFPPRSVQRQNRRRVWSLRLIVACCAPSRVK